MSKRKILAPVEPVVTFQLFDSMNRVIAGGPYDSIITFKMIIDAIQDKSADSVSIWIDGVFDARYYGGDFK